MCIKVQYVTHKVIDILHGLTLHSMDVFVVSRGWGYNCSGYNILDTTLQNSLKPTIKFWSSRLRDLAEQTSCYFYSIFTLISFSQPGKIFFEIIFTNVNNRKLIKKSKNT